MSAAASKPPTSGFHWVQLVGSARWTLAELRHDHLWYLAGDSEPMGAVMRWVRIEPPSGVVYAPEVA